ncbi:MAG TPA: L-fucose:H+ symporter permease [Bacteroidales bacterium]|nr:L-fucose:H+ symporter permease [Bacteroidales bacterium]
MKAKKISLLQSNGKNFLIPFILITSLFFAWGLANNMTDTLLAAFKRIMSMTDFQTSWVQMAFYGAYFCLAIPAAMVIKKYSYKVGILIGLAMFIIGGLLFYPASKTMMYGHFLIALYILAGGLSFLETACNPYIVEMGKKETGTRRLNLAQSFNPIGSITGVMLSKFFILSQLYQASAQERAIMSSEQLELIQRAELNAIMGPYVGVALILIVIWILIFFHKMPTVNYEATAENDNGFFADFKYLIKQRKYLSGIVAQFFYVGAQIGVWSFTIRYVMHEINVNEAEAATYYLASLVAFTVARFIFTGLMKFFKPQTLLMFSALLAIGASLVVIHIGGMAGILALVSISAFMSLMFPTIYGVTVEGLGRYTKVASSGLIMAIVGGAVLTALQGKVSDLTQSIRLSYYVPLFCFLAIAIYGFMTRKVRILSKS